MNIVQLTLVMPIHALFEDESFVKYTQPFRLEQQTTWRESLGLINIPFFLLFRETFSYKM